MQNYTFIKDYKNNDRYRHSFNTLAQGTFGLDFETWYQRGYWNENYICYSYLFEDEVVSNVSLNTMTLLIEGEMKTTIQIGTVMTHESHRRKGLALDLMHKIFEDYDQTCAFYFLAADEEAIALYKKCGFVERAENKFEIDLSEYKLSLENPLEVSKVDLSDLLRLKRSSKPLSHSIWGLDTDHVFMFYLTLGFDAYVHKMNDGYAIFEIEDDTLILYDVITPFDISLEEVICQITPQTIKRVVCMFTPHPQTKGLNTEQDLSSSWMIRSKSGDVFPKGARFPSITQT